MPFWKAILAYDGAPYHGWQVQPGLPTVQGTLAEAIRHVTRELVTPQGSGRTDTGVHALGQVASFLLKAPIPAQNLQRALNRALPPSIRITALQQVGPEFHARYSARRKTYEYRIFPRLPEGRLSGVFHPDLPDRVCPPFLAPWVWDYPWPVEGASALARANQAASCVVGEHDFTSFAAADPDQQTRRLRKPNSNHEQAGATPGQAVATRGQAGAEHEQPGATDNIRRIFASGFSVEPWPGSPAPLLIYRVTGSGFLHHMVRNLTGTFLEAAADRMAPTIIPGILHARQRAAAGPTAPPQGLFLHSVEYDGADCIPED